MRKWAEKAVWLFVFCIPWENMIVIPSWGTGAKFIGIVAAGLGVVAALYDREFRWHPFLSAGVFFVGWAGLSTFWSIDPGVSIRSAITYSQLLVMAWLVYQFGQKDFPQGLFRAYIFGTWIAVLATFVAYFQGIESSYQRFVAPGFNENDLAIYVSLSLPMAAYVLRSARGWGMKLLCTLLIPAVLLAVFLTGSRAGALAVGIGLVFIVYSIWQAQSKARTISLLILAVTIAAVLILIPPQSYARIATVLAELSTGTLNQRTVIWAAGLQIFTENPWLGVGFGAFRYAVEPLIGNPYTAHNAFVEIAAEGGLLGLILWILVLLLPWTNVFKHSQPGRWLGLSLYGILAMGLLSLNLEASKPAWLVLALVAGLMEHNSGTQVSNDGSMIYHRRDTAGRCE